MDESESVDITTKMTREEQSEPLWTVIEVANYLRLKPGTIRKMARDQEIPGIRLHNTWRFRKFDIDNFISTKLPHLIP